jgi:small-conductance mechanosensitive channel
MNFVSFESYPAWATATMAILAVFVLAYLVAELVSRFAWRFIRPILGDRAAGFTAAAPLLRPIRLIRVAVFMLVAGALILPAMELAGVQTFIGMNPRGLLAWFFGSGLRIGLILLLSYTIIRVTSLVVARFEQDVMEAAGVAYAEQAKRVRTLGDLLRSTLVVIVSCIALLMTLRELNLDITPILTGAGIAGVAIGFGAQTLVKDVISGFFLLLENQVRVGDVVAINGTGGLVEAITLRTIVLRDESGTVHIFPNGSISTLANMSKDFSHYVINLAVDYDEDPDKVMAVLSATAEELRAEEEYGSVILAPLEMIGVDSFTDAHIVVKSRIKTLPLKQWFVGRELRRRLLKRFAEAGIKFPTRQLVLHMAPGEEQLLRRLADASASPASASTSSASPASEAPSAAPVAGAPEPPSK